MRRKLLDSIPKMIYPSYPFLESRHDKLLAYLNIIVTLISRLTWTKAAVDHLILTLAFEVIFGRFVMGLSWDRLAADYNLRKANRSRCPSMPPFANSMFSISSPRSCFTPMILNGLSASGVHSSSNLTRESK